MKKLHILFPFFILALLMLPWFKLPQPKIAGFEETMIKPILKRSDYKEKIFQKKMENWWTRNFHSRNTLLIAKNTIYDFVNFHQFHSGYNGNILQGRNGVIFERDFVILKFKKYNKSKVATIAHKSVSTMVRLRDSLKKLGIETIFIIAPSKADVMEDYLPRAWQFRTRHIETPPSAYPIWEKELKDAGMLFVDGFSELKQRNMMMNAFPDSGTHWSLWGASASFVKALELLHHKNSEVPLIKILGEKQTKEDKAAERDISDLLNVFPVYACGSQLYSFAEFSENSQPLPCIIFGDSFTRQLKHNSNIAKLAFPHQCFYYENRFPSLEEWSNNLKKSKICFIVYNSTNLAFGTRIHDDILKLIDLTNRVLINSGIVQ